LSEHDLQRIEVEIDLRLAFPMINHFLISNGAKILFLARGAKDGEQL